MAGCLLSCGPLRLHAEQEGDFTYSIKDNAVTITKYTGAGGEVAIPDMIANLPVRVIEQAFGGVKNVTKITIPAGVTGISYYSIRGCADLTAITVVEANEKYSSMDGVLFDKAKTSLITYPGGKVGSYKVPAGVTSVGWYAFTNCAGLTSVTLPDSVASIGRNTPVSNNYDTVFSGCSGLTAISVEESNAKFSSLGGVLFDKAKTVLVAYPGGKTGSYVIPPSVTNIGESAFWDCSSLTGVTIPPSVTSIGPVAFYNCTGLTSLVLPTSVASIGSSAFRGCTGLSGVALPASVSSIGTWAFNGCKGLASVTFEGNAPSKIADDEMFGSFRGTAPDFAVRYYKGAGGFTTPEWKGWKTIELDPCTELVDWTSNAGKTIKGNFVKLDGNSVVVRTDDGKEHKIPFTRLSPASVAQAKMFGVGSR